MQRSFLSRAPARALAPFLKSRIGELRDQPQTPTISGERAAYTRLFLMAHVPFRSLARLRLQCEAHASLAGERGSYSEGLGRGYRHALAEIDRTLSEQPPPIDA